MTEIRDARLYRETHSTFEAYCRERWHFTDRRARQLIAAAEIGTIVPVANEGQARELVPLLDDEAELRATWTQLREEFGEKVTAAKVRAVVSDRLRSERNVASIGSSASEEWYTPTKYVDAAREVLGAIDLDPASNPSANATVDAQAFYSADDDGLAKPWHGRVWLNPPYGAKCAAFVAKLRDEYDVGNVTAAILLVSAYSTDTKWFQPLFGFPVYFTDHRIDFSHPDGRGGSSNHGSAFVYFGPRPDSFVQVFSRFGSVVERSPLVQTLRAAA